MKNEQVFIIDNYWQAFLFIFEYRNTTIQTFLKQTERRFTKARALAYQKRRVL